MRDVVVIEKWANTSNHHCVFFHGKEIGIVYTCTRRWYPNVHYERLLDCDKELVNERVDEFICMLKITNRMTS